MLEVSIRAMNGIRIDCDLSYDLAHRRQPIASSQQAKTYRLADLVNELAIGRNTGPRVKPEADQRCFRFHKLLY